MVLLKALLNFRRIARSKRGAELVEAAIVFPIIILTAITMLTIMISLYNEAAVVSQSQISEREAASEEAETGITYLVAGKKPNKSDKDGVVNFRGLGLVERAITREYLWEEQVINESMVVRYLDIGK